MANTMISELHCRAMYSIQYNTVKPIIFAALNFGGSVYYIISAPLILEFLMGSIRDVLINGVISNIRGLSFSRHRQGREIKGTQTKLVLRYTINTPDHYTAQST